MFWRKKVIRFKKKKFIKTNRIFDIFKCFSTEWSVKPVFFSNEVAKREKKKKDKKERTIKTESLKTSPYSLTQYFDHQSSVWFFRFIDIFSILQNSIDIFRYLKISIISITSIWYRIPTSDTKAVLLIRYARLPSCCHIGQQHFCNYFKNYEFLFKMSQNIFCLS